MKQVIVIDCGSGNLHSVRAGLERAAAGKNIEITFTIDPALLDVADNIILPGVGAFADCMQGLRTLPGLRERLEKRVLEDKTPFLGICVGMQMLLERGLEHGNHEGLGWIEGEVTAINPNDPALKIPHMGWNDVMLRQPDHPLLTGIDEGEHFYFVHSYHVICAHAEDVIASVDYGAPITAIIARGNIMGTQFHPEKSHQAGQKLLENFLQL